MMPLCSGCAGVDLGDHQRHVRIHPEGRRIVDDDGAGLDRDGRELPARCRRPPRTARCRRLRTSRSVSSSITIVLPAKFDGLARRARARQRLQLADRESALVHGGDEFGADSAGHAGNGNNGIVLHFALHQAIKKPRSFSGGASVQMMRSSRLRAHASRSPGGLAGFRGAFGGRHHGAEPLCDSLDRRQRLSDRIASPRSANRLNEVETGVKVTP